jgi:hypothetical protein
VRLLPDAGNVLVGLGQRRVDVDGAEDLVQADAVLHRQHVFGDQVAGMLADEGDAEDAVLARRGQHLDEAVRLAVGNGAVEVVEVVAADLVGDALLLRLLLVQADARHFGLDEGGPGDHRVVGLELLEGVEQRIDRRIPGLVRGGVGELEGAGDVARRRRCWDSLVCRKSLVSTVRRGRGDADSSRP